jgi:hypothetical protein
MTQPNNHRCNQLWSQLCKEVCATNKECINTKLEFTTLAIPYHAIVQVVRHQLLTEEPQVQSQVTVPVRFLVDKMSVGQVSLQFLGFPLLIIIPPLLHTYLMPHPEVCDTSNQAYYHLTLGLQVWRVNL